MVLDARVILPVERHRAALSLRVHVRGDTLVCVSVGPDGRFNLVPGRRDEVVRLRGAVDAVERDRVGNVGTRRVAVYRGDDGGADVHTTGERSFDLAGVGGEDAVAKGVADSTVQWDNGETAGISGTDLYALNGSRQWTGFGVSNLKYRPQRHPGPPQPESRWLQPLGRQQPRAGRRRCVLR